MPDVARLLTELERLDGAAEAAVVRGALECGVAEAFVLDQLEREVARRRARLTSAEWPSRTESPPTTRP